MKLETPDKEKLPETSEPKKAYDPPELTVLGNMQTITQSIISPGGVDAIFGFGS